MTSKQLEKINTPSEALPAEASENPNQVRTFNPLDADPAQFAVALRQRFENYDALAMHLRNQLVAGKDFGRIHVSKKCQDKWNCTYERQPGHFSKHTLFAPGADKVLGTLGLAVNYPDEQDYRRAALTGKSLDDIIIKALIVDQFGQVICEGMGSAARDEHQGNLNNTLKKALKRARLDAVLRIPSVSALFEDDFLGEIASSGDGNTVNGRQRQVKPNRRTGAELEVMPFGPFKDEKFCDLPDSQLDWCINECKNADVVAAGKKERQRRIGKAYQDNGGDGSDGLVNEPPESSGNNSGNNLRGSGADTEPPVPEAGDPGIPFDDDIPF